MSLSRCLAAEGVGSLLLAAAVVGSGMAAAVHPMISIRIFKAVLPA